MGQIIIYKPHYMSVLQHYHLIGTKQNYVTFIIAS